MSSPLAKKLTKYGIAVGLSLAVAFLYVYLRVDLTNPGATPLVDWYKILCDAFTVPGLLLVMFGCLMTLSNMGSMDGIGYAVVNGLKMLVPAAALKMERYKEYLDRRRKNRVKGYGFLYVVGAGCLAVAVVFMFLFYSVYQR